jgi:hypothetical protein
MWRKVAGVSAKSWILSAMVHFLLMRQRKVRGSLMGVSCLCSVVAVSNKRDECKAE